MEEEYNVPIPLNWAEGRKITMTQEKKKLVKTFYWNIRKQIFDNPTINHLQVRVLQCQSVRQMRKCNAYFCYAS